MDPIAQTFSVKGTNGGCFITSIDVFFKTKSSTAPINMAIAPLVGGVPSNSILAEVMKDAASITVSATAATATKFTFETPVFVDDGDYAFILETNSKDYNVWVATMGQTSISSPTAIWKQAAEGQMLTSVNKQSWTPVAASDIKYVIRKAQFNTAVTGSVIFRNKSPKVMTKTGDLIETVSGSPTVKIYLQHHGMTAGTSKVRLGFDVTTENYGGIVASTLNNNTYTVQSVGWNWFTITAGSNATTTGIYYTAGVAASIDAPMDAIALNGVVQTYIGTDFKTKFRTTSGRSISGTQTPYIKNPAWIYSDISKIHVFDTPQLVASYPNELLNMSNANSLEVGVELSTTNPNLSPMVHLDKFGAAAVGAIMNNDLTNETALKGGNALARYVTKPVQLQNPATALQVLVAANTSSESSFTVYYKIKSPKSSGSIDSEKWVEMIPTTPLVPSTSPSEFFDYTFQANNLTQFTAFKIKVVFTGTNSARAARIKDFRFMALAV